jgi:hypothetical protein
MSPATSGLTSAPRHRRIAAASPPHRRRIAAASPPHHRRITSSLILGRTP